MESPIFPSEFRELRGKKRKIALFRRFADWFYRFRSICPTISARTKPAAREIAWFNERNDLLQVVRAASPVLLRVIVLGAFFIYCTVSMKVRESHVCSSSSSSPASRSHFIFMRVDGVASHPIPPHPVSPRTSPRLAAPERESDNKAFSRACEEMPRRSIRRLSPLVTASVATTTPNVCGRVPLCANYDNAWFPISRRDYVYSPIIDDLHASLIKGDMPGIDLRWMRIPGEARLHSSRRSSRYLFFP